MPAPPTWPSRRSASAASVRTGDDEEAINRMFTPEFRNRLDAIISFARADARDDRPRRRQVHPATGRAARRPQRHDRARRRAPAHWLAEKGYDPLFGARPLARVIQEHIKKPLAEELLFGQLAKGGIVRVTKKPDEDALHFAFEERPVSPAEPKEPALVE